MISTTKSTKNYLKTKKSSNYLKILKTILGNKTILDYIYTDNIRGFG